MSQGDARLPAKLEVSGFLRSVEAQGGFGMVLRKGEPDAGTILLVIVEKQELAVLFERMPQRDGSRKWTAVKHQVIDNKSEFEDYLTRRASQDPDVWIVELTVAESERFVRDCLE